MNFDKTKIKTAIEGDIGVYLSGGVPSGWTERTILLDAMDQSYSVPFSPTIVEVANQIKSSGEPWDTDLKNKTSSVLLNCSKEVFDIRYPGIWSQMKLVIEPSILDQMEIMQLALK